MTNRKNYMRKIFLFLIVSLLPGAKAMAAIAPSFDCSKASATVEHMICTDPTLPYDDDQLSDQFNKVLQIPGANVSALRHDENAWIKNTRNKCSTVACVHQAYFDRSNALHDIALQINASDLNLPLSIISSPAKIIATVNDFKPGHLISFQIQISNNCLYAADRAPFNSEPGNGFRTPTVTGYDISNVSKPRDGCDKGTKPYPYSIYNPNTVLISAVHMHGTGLPSLTGQLGVFYLPDPDPSSNDGAIAMVNVNQRVLVWLPGAEIEALNDTSKPGIFVALIFLPSGDQKLVMLQSATPKFDPARLDILDQRLNKAVPPPVSQRYSTDTKNMYDVAEAALESAGVRTLFDNLGSLSAARRLEILNNYVAYLTYNKSLVPPTLNGQPLNGKDVVDTVTLDGQLAHLQPQSLGAWQHYADAAFNGISQVPDILSKQKLTKVALLSYAHLKSLGVLLSDDKVDFERNNITTAPQGNMCYYVAYMFSHGLKSQMLGVPQPADLLGNGQFAFVTQEPQGQAEYPYLNIQTAPGSSNYNYRLPDNYNNWQGDVFPFGKQYYVVYTHWLAPIGASLYAVGSFDGQQPCTFDQKYITSVTVDKVPGLAAAEKNSAKSIAGNSTIMTMPFQASDFTPGVQVGSNPNGEPAQYVKTDIGGFQLPKKIWLVSTDSDIRPCSLSTLGWYDENTGKLIRNPLNDALQIEQERILSCDGSTGAIIQFRNKAYIQLSVPEPVNVGDTLLEVLSVENHNLVPVYRKILKSGIYSPQG